MPASVLQNNQQLAHDFQASRVTQYGVKVPKIAEPVTIVGSIAPIAGTVVEILGYTVKANWMCLIEGIVLGFSGAPLNPGDVTFSIDINRPLLSTTGYTEKDYGIFPFAVGAFINGPLWPVQFRHRNKETIRIKGLDNVGLGGGVLQAALVGWEWPETSHGS